MNPPPADEALKIGIPHRKMWRLGCKNPTTVFYGEIGSPFMLVQAGKRSSIICLPLLCWKVNEKWKLVNYLSYNQYRWLVIVMRVLDLESITRSLYCILGKRRIVMLKLLVLKFVSEMHIDNQITHYLLMKLWSYSSKTCFSSPFGNWVFNLESLHIQKLQNRVLHG